MTKLSQRVAQAMNADTRFQSLGLVASYDEFDDKIHVRGDEGRFERFFRVAAPYRRYDGYGVYTEPTSYAKVNGRVEPRQWETMPGPMLVAVAYSGVQRQIHRDIVAHAVLQFDIYREAVAK